MARSVPEWVAKHDDQGIPPLVKLRIFERHNGICALSGRKILPGEEWHCDHIEALWKGGRHAEYNLQPVLAKPHREKSAEEQGEQAKERRIRQKHLGIFPKSKAKIPSRGFPKRGQ